METRKASKEINLKIYNEPDFLPRIRNHPEEGWEIKENKLYYKGFLVSENDDQTREILSAFQNDPSTIKSDPLKFYDLLMERGILGISRRRIARFLREEDEAGSLHQNTTKPGIQKPIKSSPWSRIQADLIQMTKLKKAGAGFRFQAMNDNSGYKFVLTIIDTFSRFAWAFPLKTKEAPLVHEKIEEVLFKYNFRKLQTDNGSEFKDPVWDSELKSKEVKHIYSTAYKARSNGAIQKFNSTLKNKIYRFLTNHNNTIWADHLDAFLENYNSSPQKTLGYRSPKKVIEDLLKDHPDEAMTEEIKKIKDKSDKYLISRNPKIPILSPGDLVRKFETNSTEVRGANPFVKGYKRTLGRDIYIVTKVKTYNDGRQRAKIMLKYSFVERSSNSSKYQIEKDEPEIWFYRNDLHLVNPKIEISQNSSEALIQDPESLLEMDLEDPEKLLAHARQSTNVVDRPDWHAQSSQRTRRAPRRFDDE